jgi:dTDP-4-amino-4,6-dideoxygalactose transaminase
LSAAPDAEPNHSFFPILVTEDFATDRDALYEKLKSRGIFARRYFYPLLSDLPEYRALPSAKPSNLPIASRASRQVLCLPIYPGLTTEDQHRVAEAIVS